MALFRSRTAFLVFLLLLARAVTSAEAPTHIAGQPIHYFYDPEATLDLDTFRREIVQGGRFAAYVEENVPLGAGAHWVFFDLPRQASLPGDPFLLEINFPNIDRVEATISYSHGTRETFLTGDEVAFNQWPVDYRKPTLPLTELDRGDASVFLRIRSETPLILPLNLVRSSEQATLKQGENFIYGLFYGAIFILAIYNAAVYVSLRDKSYRFYILYILSFSLVQASTTGLGQQYLWPNLDGATTRIALLAIIFTQYFMLQFVINFLDVPQHKPNLLKPLRWSAYLVLLMAPALLLQQYAYTQFAIHGANVVGMAVIIFATLSVMQHNRRPALYLLTSYSVLFSSIVLALLFQADMISHYTYIDFTMSAAILIEAIILSVGLSDRIALLRTENETAERENRLVQEQLAQQLITAREQERAEISRLLHDSVNHDLVVIRNKLGQLATPDGEKIRDQVEPIDLLLNKAIDEVRNISHLKHPQMVKHLGLQTALDSLVGSAFEDTVTVNVHVEDIPLPYEVQLFVYRAVQESTTNIIKHANATECIVRLYRDRATGQVHLLIKDDGIGFDAVGRNWRFGLRTLNEYCKSLGGAFRVVSSPSEGTTLSITLPH